LRIAYFRALPRHVFLFIPVRISHHEINKFDARIQHIASIRIQFSDGISRGKEYPQGCKMLRGMALMAAIVLSCGSEQTHTLAENSSRKRHAVQSL